MANGSAKETVKDRINMQEKGLVNLMEQPEFGFFRVWQLTALLGVPIEDLQSAKENTLHVVSGYGEFSILPSTVRDILEYLESLAQTQLSE